MEAFEFEMAMAGQCASCLCLVSVLCCVVKLSGLQFRLPRCVRSVFCVLHSAFCIHGKPPPPVPRSRSAID